MNMAIDDETPPDIVLSTDKCLIVVVASLLNECMVLLAGSHVHEIKGVLLLQII